MGQQPDIADVSDVRFGDQINGRNVLLRNDESWRFSDVTDEVGLGAEDSGRSTSAAWADFDSDGDQDLFVANEWSKSRLFENRDGWFVDVSDRLDQLDISQHRSVSIADFNRDAMPDFYVSAESSTRGSRVVSERRSDNLQTVDGGRKAVSASVVNALS